MLIGPSRVFYCEIVTHVRLRQRSHIQPSYNSKHQLVHKVPGGEAIETDSGDR